MLANNSQINWLPEHIRDGRFGNFWNPRRLGTLTRTLLGTPLPIWVCEQTGQNGSGGSYTDLLQKPASQGKRSGSLRRKPTPIDR